MDLRAILSRARSPFVVFVTMMALASVLGVWLPVRETARAQLLSPGTLSSAHARVEGDSQCSQCHTAGRGINTSGCLHCHAPLDARIRAGLGLHGRTYRGRSCGGCHVEHLGRGAAQIRWPGGDRNRFDHREAGWALQGAHASQACADCHRGRSYLGLGTACASCHEDPHDGRFGASCADCHGQTTFANPTVRAIDHSRTRYPLEGAHRSVACAQCHTGSPPRYTGLEFGTCASCHADPHEGRFTQPCASCHVVASFTEVSAIRQNHPGLSLGGGHARVRCESCHDRGSARPPSRGDRCVGCHQEVHEAPFGRDCVDCHRAIRWTGLSRDVSLAAHARTAFPLRGEHEAVACTGCHAADLRADARYRQLSFDACGACHEDPHRGELARFDGGECGTCHDEHGFAPTRFDVAMHGRTEFPLEGRHEAVACSGCHTLPRPRLSFELPAHACAECHENPHGAEFASEMSRGGCATCHSTEAWTRPRIDHSTWPLTGAHGNAACARCHGEPGHVDAAGHGASYRGVPRDCAGCHADPHAGQFRLREPVRACDGCHATDDFAIDAFEHRERTGFAIDGSHAALPCAGCHGTMRLADGSDVVAWRLGYRRCQDCHANPHVERDEAPSHARGRR